MIICLIAEIWPPSVVNSCPLADRQKYIQESFTLGSCQSCSAPNRFAAQQILVFGQKSRPHEGSKASFQAKTQYSICVARSTDTGHPHIGVDDDVHRTNDCIYAIKQQTVDCIDLRAGHEELVGVGVLSEGTCISNFKGVSRRNWRFRSTIEMPKCLVFYTLTLLGMRVFEPGGQGFESLRAHFLSKFFGGQGHEIGNEQIEPLTDNKTVRQSGTAPGWTSPLQRRRSGAKRRTSGAAASSAPRRR